MQPIESPEKEGTPVVPNHVVQGNSDSINLKFVQSGDKLNESVNLDVKQTPFFAGDTLILDTHQISSNLFTDPTPTMGGRSELPLTLEEAKEKNEIK